MKPVKSNFRNRFFPITAGLNKVKLALAKSVHSLSGTKKANPILKLYTIHFPGNKKGYYDGPERINRRRLILIEPEETEDKECLISELRKS